MKCFDPIPIMPSVAVVVSERRDRVIASIMIIFWLKYNGTL